MSNRPPGPNPDEHHADEAHDEFMAGRQRVLDGEPVAEVAADLDYISEAKFRDALETAGDLPPETPAEHLTRSLAEAAGRKAAIMDVREYIDDQELTQLERYELALAILDDLTHHAMATWDTAPSQADGGRNE